MSEVGLVTRSEAEEAPDPHGVPPPGDRALVARLLAGDERAFAELVAAHHGPMLRVASAFVRPRDLAEEVVQETWVAILGALPRFEFRSSLKTWMYRILTNRAKTRSTREARSLPMSALGGEDEATVDGDRFDASGRWTPEGLPGRWHRSPEGAVERAELLALVEAALEGLPERQRLVVTLRDVQGWTSEEVCNVLELSETNQRVLLHRGRARIRAALEGYLDGGS